VEFSYALEDVPVVVKQLLKEYSETKLWLFKGGLGSGKTTLIKALSKELGITEDVSSPTFGLVNTYGDNELHHFDLYRLERVEELEEIGFDDYVETGRFVFVEWPELLSEHIDPPFVLLSFSGVGNELRKLKVNHIEYSS